MRIDVSYVAKLANLPLNYKEKEKFEKQLSSILSYVQKLNEIDTKKIIPTSHIIGLKNIKQKDIIIDSLSQKKALSNTHSQQNNFFKVKKILNNV